jgi:hypothetical protein
MSEGAAGLSERMESICSGLNLARDGLLLVVLLLLMIFPASFNGILTKAGFTSASIFGFDWEKKLEAAQQETEAAKKEVQRLNTDLSTQAGALEQVAQQATDPAARERAGRVAQDLRASQVTAQRLDVKLGKNLETQKELKREFIRRLPHF